jgi:hypothetical protein
MVSVGHATASGQPPPVVSGPLQRVGRQVGDHHRAAERDAAGPRAGEPVSQQILASCDAVQVAEQHLEDLKLVNSHPASIWFGPKRYSRRWSVRGFFHPKSATGRSSLIPSPPWFYSGDLLTIEYRTDPAKVAALLPPPLTPAAEDPRAVALIWVDKDFDPAPWIEAGARFGATLAAADRRLAEAVVTLREPDASLTLLEAPTGELASLQVDELIGVYYRQVGVTWDGGRVLATS